MRVGFWGLTPDRILPEAYRLRTACSPHRAAELDGIAIDPARLVRPAGRDPLVIEGGGALVPLARDVLLTDMFAEMRAVCRRHDVPFIAAGPARCSPASSPMSSPTYCASPRA